MPQTLLGQCQQCTARNPVLKGPFIAQKNCYGRIAWAHMTSIVVLHSKNLCIHSMHKWLPSKAQVKDAIAYTTNSAESLFQGKRHTFKLYMCFYCSTKYSTCRLKKNTIPVNSCHIQTHESRCLDKARLTTE